MPLGTTTVAVAVAPTSEIGDRCASPVNDRPSIFRRLFVQMKNSVDDNWIGGKRNTWTAMGDGLHPLQPELEIHSPSAQVVLDGQRPMLHLAYRSEGEMGIPTVGAVVVRLSSCYYVQNPGGATCSLWALQRKRPVLFSVPGATRWAVHVSSEEARAFLSKIGAEEQSKTTVRNPKRNTRSFADGFRWTSQKAYKTRTNGALRKYTRSNQMRANNSSTSRSKPSPKCSNKRRERDASNTVFPKAPTLRSEDAPSLVQRCELPTRPKCEERGAKL